MNSDEPIVYYCINCGAEYDEDEEALNLDDRCPECGGFLEWR